MGYKIHVTKHADELLDDIICHLLYSFKNDQAAKHLLDSISKIYDRLADNPYQFHSCNDEYLNKKGYMEAVVSGMDYIVIFSINENVVNIMGVFHQLENYKRKL